MLNIGPQELLVVLLIALLIVGPQRLPELGRTVGKGLRELRRAQDEVRRSLNEGLDGSTGDVIGPLRDTARELRGTAGAANRAARSADPRRVTRPLHRTPPTDTAMAAGSATGPATGPATAPATDAASGGSPPDADTPATQEPTQSPPREG